MTERDRVRDTGLKALRGREGGREGGLYLAWRKKERSQKTVSSCHRPELSSTSESRLEKNTSLFLTYNSPLSVSQHQSAHHCWTQKRQDDLCESTPSDSWINPLCRASHASQTINITCHWTKIKQSVFHDLLEGPNPNPSFYPASNGRVVFLNIISPVLLMFLCLSHLLPLPFTQCLLSDQYIPAQTTEAPLKADTFLISSDVLKHRNDNFSPEQCCVPNPY